MGTRDWSRDQSRDIKTNNNLRLATCPPPMLNLRLKLCSFTCRATCDLRPATSRAIKIFLIFSRCFFGRLNCESATGRAISRATSKRTTICDLRLATNRKSHVTRQQNEQQPATCDQSHVAGRRSRDM